MALTKVADYSKYNWLPRATKVSTHRTCRIGKRKHFTSFILEVHPRTGHEGPRGGGELQLFSLTTALDEGGWLTPSPCRFTPRERDPVPIVLQAG